jgi:hypothetical protein
VKLVCTGSTGADLPADVLERSGNTTSSRFNVTVGAEYIARAMALWSYGIGILVVDDTGRPGWKLLNLFAISDGRLPDNWEFAVVEKREPVLAFWGYPALINDIDHHDNLIDRKKSALEAFLRESGADSDPRLRRP